MQTLCFFSLSQQKENFTNASEPDVSTNLNLRNIQQLYFPVQNVCIAHTFLTGPVKIKTSQLCVFVKVSLHGQKLQMDPTM